MKPPSSPEICNCAALLLAGLRVARHYEAAIAPAGVTLEEFMILSKIDRLGKKTVSELADLLVLDPSVMAYKLKAMVERHLVTSTIGARDRRCRTIALATKGRLLLAKAKPLWAAVNDRFEAAVGPPEANALRTALGGIASYDLGGAASV